MMRVKFLSAIFLVFASDIFLLGAFFPWEHVLNNNNGIKKYSEKKYSESEQLFLKAQKEDPDNDNIKFNLGTSYYKQKKYVESQSIYIDILKKEGLDGNLRQKAHYNLGNIFYRMGEQSNPDIFWHNALQQYEQALSIKPDDKNAKENYEFLKNKLKKLNPPDNSQQNNSQNKEKTKPDPNKNNAYSNEPLSQPQNSPANITNSEAENIMEEMKNEEAGMQNFINKRQINGNTDKDKSRMIKKDW